MNPRLASKHVVQGSQYYPTQFYAILRIKFGLWEREGSTLPPKLSPQPYQYLYVFFLYIGNM